MRDLRDLITESEDNALYTLRAAAICKSSEDLCSNHYLLRLWNDAKLKYLATPFKDSLILKKEIEYDKGFDELEDNFYSSFYTDSSVTKLRNALEGKIFFQEPKDLEEKILFQDSKEENHLIYYALFNSVNLINNNFSSLKEKKKKTLTFTFPNGKTFRIEPDTKVSKAITKICKELHLSDLWEPVRILHSQLLNQKMITGTLCLSIHPLDYLTASVNNYGWSSCMNILEEGDYCRGVVEMMNSPYVVVAYIEGQTPMEYWNSKKWREFFIVDPEVGIIGIKGYPYWNQTLEYAVCEWLQQLYPANDYGKLVDDKFGNMDLTITCGPAMYNDFYGNNNYIQCLKKEYHKKRLNYSGEAVCLQCGEVCDWDNLSENNLICPVCSGLVKCDNCDVYYDPEEMVYPDDDSCYCQDCYDSLFQECVFCDDSFPRSDMKPVNLIYNRYDKMLVHKDDWCSCKDCYNKNVINAPKRISFKPEFYGESGSCEALNLATDITKEGQEILNAITLTYYYNTREVIDF